MGHTVDEFNTAMNRARIDYPHVRVFKAKAELVLAHVRTLWEEKRRTGVKFRTIIEEAINKSQVQTVPERSFYATVVGYVYTTRAQAAKKRKKAAAEEKIANLASRKVAKSLTPETGVGRLKIVQEKNGQYAFVL